MAVGDVLAAGHVLEANVPVDGARVLPSASQLNFAPRGAVRVCAGGKPHAQGVRGLRALKARERDRALHGAGDGAGMDALVLDDGALDHAGRRARLGALPAQTTVTSDARPMSVFGFRTPSLKGGSAL